MSRPALTLARDDGARLAGFRSPAFRRAHPGVIILLRGPVPKAWVGDEMYVRGSLRSLPGKLDEMFPPGSG